MKIKPLASSAFILLSLLVLISVIIAVGTASFLALGQPDFFESVLVFSLVLVRVPLFFGGLLGVGCVLPLTVLACIDKSAGFRERLSTILAFLVGSLLLLGIAIAIPVPEFGWH